MHQIVTMCEIQSQGGATAVVAVNDAVEGPFVRSSFSILTSCGAANAVAAGRIISAAIKPKISFFMSSSLSRSSYRIDLVLINETLQTAYHDGACRVFITRCDLS